MATASGDAGGARGPVMPYVAYGVVLLLLGGAGVAFWLGQKERASPLPSSLPASDRAAPPATMAAPAEPPPSNQGLKLPPRPPVPATSARKPVPVPVPAAAAASPPSAPTSPSPAIEASPPASSPAEAGTADPEAAPAEKPAPVRTRCGADGAPWPAERTEQGKAIQGMLRDLGLYDGTVYGTVGPATRAAIRKFQASAGQPETGEPDEALFDSLRRTCAAPTP